MIHSKYLNHIIKIKFNRETTDEKNLIGRVKETDDSFLLIGPYVLYGEEQLSTVNNAIENILEVEVNGIDYSRGRGVQGINLETAVHKDTIARIETYTDLRLK